MLGLIVEQGAPDHDPCPVQLRVGRVGVSGDAQSQHPLVLPGDDPPEGCRCLHVGEHLTGGRVPSSADDDHTPASATEVRSPAAIVQHTCTRPSSMPSTVTPSAAASHQTSCRTTPTRATSRSVLSHLLTAAQAAARVLQRLVAIGLVEAADNDNHVMVREVVAQAQDHSRRGISPGDSFSVAGRCTRTEERGAPRARTCQEL